MCPYTRLAMETHDILYETLSPLDANAADTPPPPSSPSSPEIEPYVVLRNQIALSSAETPLPETPAIDYFSLDLNEPEDVKQSSVLATQKAAAKVSAPAASDRTLEGSWFRANSGFKSPMMRLHKEILDFCDFLSPTPEEQESRNAAIKSVSDVINYIWSDAKVEVFGSFKTGLYLPSSDVDVVILGSCVTSPKLGLQALSKALSQKGIAKKIQVIAKARVPIIKFVEKKSGFSFDVSFDAHNGPKAAEFIKDAVSRWPPLRPLCLILKVFLQQRELNEVYTGGIGSYALLAMLIAMLRTQQESQASPEHNLGILLVRFFDMYGCKLNTVDVGVSCRSGGSFYQKVSRGFTVDGRPSLISIEDPQDPDNDIGKNSFNYYQAKSAFSMAFTTLTNTKALLRLGPNRSILSAIIRPDAVLLERKGGSARKPAYNNLFLGSGEPMQQLFSEQQEIYCNWQLNDEEEEPLPRGNGILGDNTPKSSGKKRKVLKEKKSSKSKRGAAEGVEENGSIEPKRKKHSRRSYQTGGYGDGYSPYKEGSSNWSRHR